MHRTSLDELIQADLDGELTVAERALLARLLLRDPDARRLHEEFRRTDQLLRDVSAAEPPEGLRASILAESAMTARPANPAQRQFALPHYRVAAAILGGLLIAGLAYFLIDADVPAKNLQGSLGAAGDAERSRLPASPDHLSMRADGAEVSASLRRDGDRLRLELRMSTAIPSEIIARIDPSMTTFVGQSGPAQVTAAAGAVTVVAASGTQDVVLDFSGAAPIWLELRSEGRLLGEGSLSVAGAP